MVATATKVIAMAMSVRIQWAGCRWVSSVSIVTYLVSKDMILIPGLAWQFFRNIEDEHFSKAAVYVICNYANNIFVRFIHVLRVLR